jgi:hypothetical protein
VTPLILLLLGAWTVGACEKEEKPTLSQRSEVAVQLPAKPSLTEPVYTKTHSDGSWTVEGLMRNRDDNLGKIVKVTGKLVEVAKCPEPEPYSEEELAKYQELLKKYEKMMRVFAKQIKSGKLKAPPKPELIPLETARTCNVMSIEGKALGKPHAVLVDEGGDNERFRLLVAGTMWSQLRVFDKGKAVTVEGMFDMVSPDGHYVEQRGLVHLKETGRPPLRDPVTGEVLPDKPKEAPAADDKKAGDDKGAPPPGGDAK